MLNDGNTLSYEIKKKNKNKTHLDLRNEETKQNIICEPYRQATTNRHRYFQVIIYSNQLVQLNIYLKPTICQPLLKN